MNGPTTSDKMRLQNQFGFEKMPFSKYRKASEMYESTSQQELQQGLQMWLLLGGLALVCGPSGVGKTISLRRFAVSLDKNQYAVYTVPTPPATVHGFLRTICRCFGIAVKHYTVDLFDAAQKFLINHEKEHGTHPLLIIDDAEGLYPDVADLIRRLTVYNLDAKDRFSVLVAGIESLLQVLELGVLEPLRSRFAFGYALRPFGLEETKQYIHFQINSAGGDPKLFSDEALKRIFHLSCGKPRSINQLCIGALIQAALRGRDTIDGPFLKAFVADHPLFQNQGVTE